MIIFAILFPLIVNYYQKIIKKNRLNPLKDAVNKSELSSKSIQ